MVGSVSVSKKQDYDSHNEAIHPSSEAGKHPPPPQVNNMFSLMYEKAHGLTFTLSKNGSCILVLDRLDCTLVPHILETQQHEESEETLAMKIPSPVK